ncbi:MAG TPA: hypothetical protein VMY37_12705 [Thermoguttaceae bacterium]|nr:hypothetical protein [Thermoguttaceae bacterium]
MLQLDKTRIAIRERAYVDILDLALRVIRVHAGPLVLAFAAGVAPMLLLNGWLLAGYAELDFEWTFPFVYPFYMVLLIFLEAPLATAPATLYLGKATFTDRPEPREILREFRESLPQLLIYQGLLGVWHFRWTYLNEVILLDRNPMRRRAAGGVSTLERSRVLHKVQNVDTASRSLPALIVGGTLFIAIWASIFIVRGMLLGQWGLVGFLWALFSGQWEWSFLKPMFTFYFQLSIWIVVCYFTVVRFLTYLDLRIRREGWEVELWMRAERARLVRHWK